MAKFYKNDMIKRYEKKLYELEWTLWKIAYKELPEKSLEVLLHTYLSGEGMIKTKLIGHLSSTLNYSESTIRWNLNNLIKTNFIETGNKNNKSVKTKLTIGGEVVAKYLALQHLNDTELLNPIPNSD